MGQVYRARDVTLGRDVALKFMPDEVTEGKRILRFLQEARLASSLSHPNIATIHEVGETAEGRPFIAMELVEGRSLAQRMKAGTMSRAEIVDVASQIAAALEAANERGITHRDIKPQNVMIDRRGTVKVLDFGLAKATRWPFDDGDDHAAPAIQVETEPGQIVGTVHYMSPEQALGTGTDPRSDIFSLGVILFEMATGRRPFEGSTPTQVINAVLHAEPPPLPPWFSGPFEDLVRRCLAKEREKRPSSATALRAEIQYLRQAEPDEATAMKPAAAAGSRKTRGMVFAALALAALVTAAVLWIRDRGDPVTPGSGEIAVAPARIESLAVLPFSVSGNADGHEGEALAESLIFRLSKIPEMRVISRNSSFRFEYDPGAVRDIAAQLGVDALLLGTIAERGGKLHVTAELVSAADERALWGERFERAPDEWLRIEETIANGVATRAGFAPSRLASSPTSSVEAHKLYLEGRYYWSRYPAPESAKAVELFRAAIDVDPSFALAWVGLADTYGLPAAFGHSAPEEGWPRLYALLDRAIALDPDLGELHNSLGAAAFFDRRDLVRAEYHLRRAMELNPNYPDAYLIMSILELWRGNREELAHLIGIVSRLDPLSDRTQRGAAKGMHMLGRLDEAEASYRKAIMLNPAVPQTHEELGDVLEALGRGEEAIASWRRGIELSSTAREALDGIDAAAPDGAPAVRRVIAHAKLAEFEHARKAGRYVSETELIRQWLRAGDRAKALASVDRALEERNRNVFALFVDFPFTTLAGEPVYEAARERLRKQEPFPPFAAIGRP
jgi:eukaryotic-like serine/threonine-protein kinase